MNTEYLYAMNLVMLTRLAYLGRDLALSTQGLVFMIVLHLAGAMVFHISPAWLAAFAGTVVLTNLMLYWFEKMRGGKSDGMRFVTLIVYGLAFSILFSSRFNPSFDTDALALLQNAESWSLIFSGMRATRWQTLHAVLFGLLLLSNEVNFVIRFIFSLFNLVPEKTTQENSATDGSNFNLREYSAGRLIGILERILILFFVLANQFTAIAFIIAAKGIARFKELDEREFAEYVLIGTLLSATLAIIVAMGVRMIVS